MAQLGAIADFEMGQAPPATQCNSTGEGTVFVKAGEFGKESPLVREWTTKPLKFAKDGDVLMCVVGATAGKLNLGIDCAIGRSVAAIRPSIAISTKLLYRQLSLQVQSLRAASTGSAQGVISKEMLSQLEIAVPPAAEQQRIADKLDTVLARVDAVNDRLARVAPLLKRFRQSVLAAATSGRLSADWRMGRSSSEKYLEDPIYGEMPASWCVASIEDIKATERNALAIGPFGSNLTTADYQAAGVPLVFVREIRARLFGDERTKFVTPEKAVELSSHLVAGGDILITKMGDPPGDVAIYPSSRPEAVITADCIKLRIDSTKVNRSYVAYALESPAFRKVLSTAVAGVAQQKVSLARFKVLPLVLPTLAEQIEIVRRVDLLFAFADRLDARLQAAQTASARLTPALLAKAFRGELVPQDPNDEPATELLRRLAASKSEPAKKPRARKATA